MDLAGKLVLVTGASSGIGRALAFEFARCQCRLVLTALEGDRLEAVAAELRSRESARVEVRQADMTDSASRGALLEWIRARGEPLDVVVSNAGGGRFARFTGAAWEDLRRTIALNVEAPTQLLRDLVSELRKRPKARIVIIGSGIGRLPYPGLAVYGACKGYLASLGESLACELLGTNVGVLVFFPGFTRTGFMSAAGMDMSRVPRFMIGSPERVARRIVRCVRLDRQWAYSDLYSRLAAFSGPLFPSCLRVRILRNLFWRLPDDL